MPLSRLQRYRLVGPSSVRSRASRSKHPLGAHPLPNAVSSLACSATSILAMVPASVFLFPRDGHATALI